jgi:hypothetical protein
MSGSWRLLSDGSPLFGVDPRPADRALPMCTGGPTALSTNGTVEGGGIGDGRFRSDSHETVTLAIPTTQTLQCAVDRRISNIAHNIMIISILLRALDLHYVAGSST